MPHSFGPILDPALIGAKAANLERLVLMGFPVPATFVLPNGRAPGDDARLANWLPGIATDDGRWKLAVRSSSPAEDGAAESKAGHFLSLTGQFDAAGLEDAISRVQASGPEMAVIVQPLVEPAFVGAYFSCDPLSFERRKPLIAWTEGLADALLSGLEVGERIQLDSQGRCVEGEWPGEITALEQLKQAGTQLEQLFGAPADIEWAVDRKGLLWFLQARPIVLPNRSQVRLEGIESFDRLPSVIRGHHKIKLRRQAAALGILMAPAIVESRTSRPSVDADSAPVVLGDAAAASVVLLHPEHIDCAVVREFAPLKGTKMNAWTERCRRYAVRRYPSVDGVDAAKASVLKVGLGQSWLATAIVQAVWDALATGIIRRTADSYFIDVAQGHFVPKGVVSTSTIMLSRNREVLSEQWREQSIAYHFVDGHVVTETPPKQQLKFAGHHLVRIAETLDPLFDVYQDAALEFGLLGQGEDLRVYLIDIAEGDEASVQLDGDMIKSGVLSTGLCQGRIIKIANSVAGALESHLYDRRVQSQLGNDPVVIVAEQASTDLLPYICAPGVAGFVFRHASVLAHLPVVLREKGIPAIALEDLAAHQGLSDGTLIELDAVSRLATPHLRIRRLAG